MDKRIIKLRKIVDDPFTMDAITKTVNSHERKAFMRGFITCLILTGLGMMLSKLL